MRPRATDPAIAAEPPSCGNVRALPYLPGMRYLLAALFFTAPVHAWEFSAAPICTLTHSEPGAEVRLTYDPRGPLYTITLTGPDWPSDEVFAIRFDGPRPLTITTNRQQIEGPALTVTDRGFGNVLNGLEFNQTATAILGDTALPISLTDAAEPVRAFRACVSAPLA